MKRSSFLQTLIPAAALAAVPGRLTAGSTAEKPAPAPVWPPFLRKGDAIGITCPAGPVRIEDIQPALDSIRAWGFEPVTGSTIGKQFSNMGGTDAERLQDFQQLLDDSRIRAILCARGGYGAVRIVDQLNLNRFRKHPKWIIGFSDITLLHAHFHRHTGVVGVHSKMCNSFPKDPATADPVQLEGIDSIRRCLQGEPVTYETASHPQNIPGTANGQLVGGNLRTLESLAGTTSSLHTAGKILFLEDTGEYLYSIDRMLWNLKRSGRLDNLKGLIIGGFRHKPSEEVSEEFGLTLQEMVLEKIPRGQFPVCFGFPVGHQKNNVALLHGARHELTVTNERIQLTAHR